MSGLAEKIYGATPVAVQNFLLSEYGRRIRRVRFGGEYDRLSALLGESERWSPGELRAYQDERLASLIAHAYATVPFYRERMDALRLKPSDVRSVPDLPKLPILSREDIVAGGERLTSTAVPGRRLWKAATSGTTGAVLSVSWDRGVVVMTNACLWRSRRWGGVEFGRPYATLFGRCVAPAAARPPFWRVNRSWNQLMLSPIHLSDATAPLYLEAMSDFGVEALEAYPSSAYILARYAEDAGVRLPLKCVFTTSEPLLPLQRAVIEDRFRCRVFDFYSQAERVMFSSECETHDGHHVFEEYGVTELVDGSGLPVPAGSVGRVVATSLHNFGMPLVRYALRDVTSMGAGPCRCGRTLAIAAAVATKEEDVLVAPDGRLIPPSLVSPVFKDAHPVAKSQIVQVRRDEIVVRIVRLGEFTPDDERHVEHGFKVRLGQDVRVRFEYVKDIPCTARGKFRWIVSTVPLPWGGAGLRAAPDECA
jgi:phenylacetate-CoA ligase